MDCTHQAPLSLGLSRQECWSGLPFPSQGIFLTRVFFLILFFIYLLFNFNWRLITLQYCGGFCHTFTWISYGCTCVPHPNPPTPPSQSHPSGSSQCTSPRAPCLMHQTWTGSRFNIWWYTCFNAILSNHPTLTFSHSPTVCSFHLCLFSCHTYRVIVTVFLNSQTQLLNLQFLHL